MMVWAMICLRRADGGRTKTFRLGSNRARLFLCLSLAALCGTSALAAPIRVSDGKADELANLATGQQLILDRRSGPLTFAGREILLDDFIGVAGYASEAAYLIVLSGSARLAGEDVGPGRMLLLPPFGGEPMVERFDAARLRDAWPQETIAAAPEAYRALDRIADRQALRIFLGGYKRTNFNVAASGAAGQELPRRAVIGGPAVRAIRFNQNAAPSTVEYRVIATVARALADRDAASVAELLDPGPFGGRGMGTEGAGARLLFANSLVEQRDWKRQLTSIVAARGPEGNQWLLAGPNGRTVITLQPTTDFAFVKAISAEETP